MNNPMTNLFATFISLTEIRKIQNDIKEVERQGSKKWKLFYRCRLTSKFAKEAIRQYNKRYKRTYYRFKKIILAEKAIEEESKIRLFFKVCTKTYRKNSRDIRKGRKHRRCRRTCDHFRATIERYKSFNITITVRNLDKETGKLELYPSKDRRGHLRNPKK
uniref:Transposase n=1 Tax=Strongyloides venezuelensis TaxID=75913 RepID=A0A0K0EZR3_STRVS